MASQTSVQVPTPTPTEWAGLQNAQRAAKNFFLQADGPAGKANVRTFQAAFNGAVPALKKIIASRNGNPNAMDTAVPLDARKQIAVDGEYGPQTRNAIGLIIMFSFPAGDANKASSQFISSCQVRAKVAAWTKAWSADVANMVSKDYSQVVSTPSATTPATVPSSALPGAGQQQTQQVVDQGMNPSIPKPGTQPTNLPTPKTPVPVPIDEPAVITAQTDSSYAWVWWVLGLAGVGGGVWYFFGRKKRG